MPKKAMKLDIEVQDLGSIEGLRHLAIEVKADSSSFVTSDFCAAEGVVKALSTSVRESVKDAVLTYIRSGSDIMQKVKTKRQTKASGTHHSPGLTASTLNP